MGYYEFTFAVADEAREALIGKAFAMGCLGCHEKGRSIVAYFTDMHDIIKLRDEVIAFRSSLRDGGLARGFSFDYNYLSERDWNEPWKKRFVPIHIGERLSVLPPWEKGEDGRIHIIIDPGMAFGTGHHETTKACLGLIEKYAGVTGKGKVLDVGTGTGILVIAASKLGYEEGIGVDIDPLAVDAAGRNLLLNSLRNVGILEGDISAVSGRFDLIVANLMSDVLIRIAPDIAVRLEDSGVVILSGMMVGQDTGVVEAIEKEGLNVIERHVDGRWVTLAVERDAH